MQGFRFAAISDVEKTKLRRKNFQSQWTVKYRSRAQVKVCARRVCQGQLLCKVSDLQLSLMSRKPNFDVKIIEVSGP